MNMLTSTFRFVVRQTRSLQVWIWARSHKRDNPYVAVMHAKAPSLHEHVALYDDPLYAALSSRRNETMPSSAITEFQVQRLIRTSCLARDDLQDLRHRSVLASGSNLE